MDLAAKRINELHHAMINRTVQDAIKIGGLLVKQKEACRHGNWEKWMKDNLEFSMATAKRYMRIFHRIKDDKSVNLTDLKLSELYQSPISQADRMDYIREQEQYRTQKRNKFANRKYNYKNPPKGEYVDQIICGDCLSVMQEMSDNGMADSLDVIITSPPYNNGKNYGKSYNDSKSYEEYLSMIKEFISKSYDLLRKGGRLIINFSDIVTKNKNGDRHYNLEADIIRMVREMDIALYEMDKVIWYKQHSGSDKLRAWGSFRSPSNPKMRTKYETVLIFCKEQHNLPKVSSAELDMNEDEFLEWTKNVWTIDAYNKASVHPCVYPEELAKRLIKLYSWTGGIVADFFCGSGTTCAVAKKYDRKYVGVDQNPNYCQYSKDRIELSKKELEKKYEAFLGGKPKKKANTEGDKNNLNIMKKSA